jgi:hypothetical protein
MRTFFFAIITLCTIHVYAQENSPTEPDFWITQLINADNDLNNAFSLSLVGWVPRYNEENSSSDDISSAQQCTSETPQTPLDTIAKFVVEHELSTASDVMRAIDNNIFHEAILLWSIAQGYSLPTLRKICICLRKKIASNDINEQQFNKLVACHANYPLDPNKIDKEIIKYVENLCDKEHATIQKIVARHTGRTNPRTGVCKYVTSTEPNDTHNQSSLHFTLCSSASGISLVARPFKERRKRQRPKTLGEIISRR